MILLWGGDEERRVEPDAVWLEEWAEMGFHELTVYLARCAEFDDYLRRTGR